MEFDYKPVSRWDVKDIKDKAKIAKTINWSKIKDMMKKFDMSSPMMMAIHWDHEIEFGVKKKPFPFHRHYRINLEKMLFTGCFTPKQADKLIEYAKSLKMPKDEFGPEEIVD